MGELTTVWIDRAQHEQDRGSRTDRVDQDTADDQQRDAEDREQDAGSSSGAGPVESW